MDQTSVSIEEFMQYLEDIILKKHSPDQEELIVYLFRNNSYFFTKEFEEKLWIPYIDIQEELDPDHPTSLIALISIYLNSCVGFFKRFGKLTQELFIKTLLKLQE